MEVKSHLRVLMTGSDWFARVPGGLPRYFYDLLRSFPAQGVSPVALVRDAAGASAPPGTVVRSFEQGPGKVAKLLGARRMIITALREPVDVINSHFAYYLFPSLDLIPKGVPLVCNFQGPWALEGLAEASSRTGRVSWTARLQSTAKFQVERQVYKRTNRFIVLSRSFRDILCQHYKVSPDVVRVIPGAVDIEAFQPSVEKTKARLLLGWPTDRPIVLSIRRLARRMGLENLIDSVALIRKQVPDVLVLIGGRGSLGDELKVRIQERGLSDHVRLLGFVPDDQLSLAYRAADLTVVPTVALEGFGLITIESLACGTPVMATPVSALPEVLQGLDRNLLFESIAPAHIAAGLSAALRGHISLPNAADCRRFVVDNHSWPVIAARVKAVFEEVL